MLWGCQEENAPPAGTLLGILTVPGQISQQSYTHNLAEVKNSRRSAPNDPSIPPSRRIQLTFPQNNLQSFCSSHPSRAMTCKGETFFPTRERSGGDLYSKSWSPLEFGKSPKIGILHCRCLRRLWNRFGAAGFEGSWWLERGAEEEAESPGATCALRGWQLSFPRDPEPVDRRDGNCRAALPDRIILLRALGRGC